MRTVQQILRRRSSAELEGEPGPAAAATAAARRPAEAEVLPAAAAHGAGAAAEEGLEYLVGVDVLREGVAAPVALQVLQVVAVVVPARMISISTAALWSIVAALMLQTCPS